MSTTTVIGPTSFEGLPDELKGPIAEGMRTALRIEAAKETAARVEAALQVVDDLPFWARRVCRAIKRGEYLTTNRWSWRGNVSATYLEALQRQLTVIDPRFQVSRTYYSDPLGITTPKVVVSWKG